MDVRIVHVTAPAGVGGLEQVVIELCRGFVDRGHEVVVACVTDDESSISPFVAALRDARVEPRTMSVARRDYLGERRLVRALLREIRPDVFHTHGYRCDVVDSGVAGAEGVATVSTVHGFTGGGRLDRLYEWLQLRSYRSLDHVIAVSSPIRERLLASGVAREKISLVRNTVSGKLALRSRVEAQSELGLREDTFNVAWIGRLSHEKGPDVMLQAAQHLTSDNVMVHFIGDGPFAEAVQRNLQDPGARLSVRLHGLLPRASTRLRGFDAVALTSRTEGTPMVLLEAMAAEVPIVTTRVGGVPDLVTPSEAILVESEDPERVAAGIRELAHDRDRAAALAAAARARLERHFSFDLWIDAYEGIYTSVRRGRGG